jgi:uncharacterized protein YybS (DUF2232 family)
MPTQTRQLAENALMLGIALVLLFISTYTLLGMVTVLLIPIPFVLLGLRRTVKNLVWIVLVFTVLGSILTGLMGGGFSFVLAALGAVMGYMYQSRRTALSAVIAGAVVIFLSYMALLAVSLFALHIDFDAILQQAAKMKPPFMTEEEFQKQISAAKMVLPTFFVVSSFFYSGLVHWLSRVIGNRTGRPVPPLKPLREWSFPRSLLYYYFVALLCLLLFGDKLEETFWASAISNVKVLLDILFTLQGLSFCLFAFHLKGWKILTPVLVVSLFIFPFLATILSLLGIFDLGVDLRKKLETRVKRG